jgi:AAA family ATPase
MAPRGLIRSISANHVLLCQAVPEFVCRPILFQPSLLSLYSHHHHDSTPAPTTMSTFTVRPAGTDKDPFRIRLTTVSMLSLKLKSGDICEIGSETGGGNKRKLAIAWEGLGSGMKDTVVQTSKILQEAYGFKLGDKITISRSSGPIEDTDRVILQKTDLSLDAEDIRYWSKHVAAKITGTDGLLMTTLRIRASEGIEFVVKDVGLHDSMLARLTPATVFKIVNENEANRHAVVLLEPAHLGGIDKQIKEVQAIIQRVTRAGAKQYRADEPVQGILLYGAKGTGKTALIESLAESGWSSVITWKPGTQPGKTNDPCLVIVPTQYLRTSASASAIAELVSLFKIIASSPVLVIAECRHPNNIDEQLRTEGKFATEIELPIPTTLQRKDILLSLTGEGSIFSEDLLSEMAQRTHGYVGVDLRRLLRVTLENATARSPLSEPDSEPSKVVVTSSDLDVSLQSMRPSALQEVFLETPNVRWSDIGGQHDIKRQLRNAVERPLKHADRMKKLRLQPKKGVLLYGPPGCSKTLLVRALATEAGLNFLAVKGAELISMYVGESERATREVFRKARAARPSIIFFDEIDAIASRGRSGSDLNVLTTLLNEMDGFEELRNVFVVAATNKPQQIDPALMRPGRFDSVVYIGPPDLEARKEILAKQLGQGLYQSKTGLDVDAAEFAEWTDGFSGADVVAVCQNAGEAAFDDERDYIVFEDLKAAVSTTRKSITKKMLEEYEAWNAAQV